MKPAQKIDTSALDRKVNQVFDCDRFVGDVIAFLDRHRLSRRWLFGITDSDVSSGLQVLNGLRPVSLDKAARFAIVCDLSLDEYLIFGAVG
jgi:hypothetical protein